MSGSKGDEALAEYKKALEVMSARKSAPKRVAPSEDNDEVQIIRSSKRQAVAAGAPSSSKKKSKASSYSPKGSPSAPYDWATVLTNLNAKVFPSTPVLLASEEDSSMACQSLQGDLLQVIPHMILWFFYSGCLSELMRRWRLNYTILGRGWKVQLLQKSRWRLWPPSCVRKKMLLLQRTRRSRR